MACAEISLTVLWALFLEYLLFVTALFLFTVPSRYVRCLCVSKCVCRSCLEQSAQTRHFRIFRGCLPVLSENPWVPPLCDCTLPMHAVALTLCDNLTVSVTYLPAQVGRRGRRGGL